jgi:hypothetical protein
MTSKDKTADQLVASIRKSKTGTVAQKNRTRSTAKKAPARRAVKPAASTQKMATARSAAEPDASAPKKTAARTPAESASSGKNSGGYSHGRRVWPD